jgi:hypothetical protein
MEALLLPGRRSLAVWRKEEVHWPVHHNFSFAPFFIRKALSIITCIDRVVQRREEEEGGGWGWWCDGGAARADEQLALRRST